MSSSKTVVPFWKRGISPFISQEIPIINPVDTPLAHIFKRRPRNPRKSTSTKAKIPQVWFNAKTSFNKHIQIDNDNNIFDEFLKVDLKKAKKPPKKPSKKPKKPPMKSVRIRIYPTTKQKETLTEWMDATRHTYNLCVTYVNTLQGNSLYPPHISTDENRNMRQLYVGKKGVMKTDPKYEWFSKVPQEMRENALRDVKKSIEAHYAKQKQNQTTFKLKYRSKVHDNYQNVIIAARQWSLKNGKVSTLLKTNELLQTNTTYNIPDELHGDSRILRHKSGRWYFWMPIPLDVKTEVKPSKKIVALDPGVRTFMTGYDQFGHVTEYAGDKDNCRMFKRAMIVDKLVSRSQDMKRSHNSRRNHRRCAQKLRDKIKNRINDMHHRVANHLLQTNDVILIPSFNVKDMVSKKMKRRLLRKSSTRSMLHWAHFRFRQYLLHKVREYPGKQVHVVTEEYTSKTCGVCGTIHHNLGGEKHFDCPNPNCRLSLSRDWNGARNTLIKYMTENHNKIDLELA